MKMTPIVLSILVATSSILFASPQCKIEAKLLEVPKSFNFETTQGNPTRSKSVKILDERNITLEFGKKCTMGLSKSFNQDTPLHTPIGITIHIQPNQVADGISFIGQYYRTDIKAWKGEEPTMSGMMIPMNGKIKNREAIIMELPHSASDKKTFVYIKLNDV